jgi:Tol biopolymer transport system component
VVRVLPADLPDDRRLGAPADLLDRTRAGRVAVASLQDVVIENPDGSARVVVPVGGVYDGRFSPDGSKLVLASLSCGSTDYRCNTVSVVDSDGRNLHLLDAHAGAARWAGNAYLAYVGGVGPNGVGTLRLEAPDGGDARVLGRSFASPAPAPSPDKRLVVDQCRAQLVCIRTVTAPTHVVARFSGALVEPALWSPNGNLIGMTRAGNYTTTTTVADLARRTAQRISSPAFVGTDDAVIGWSPDSRTILVQRRCSGGQLVGPTPCRDQVFSEHLPGLQRRRLTRDDQKWESVRWTRTSLTYVTPPTG